MGHLTCLALAGTLAACRGDVAEIAAGKDYVCARFEHGQTDCHNYDMSGGPDAWDEGEVEWPSLETPKERLTTISTRYHHLCGLDRAGELHCVGRKDFYSPLPAGPLVDVTAGNYSTCALDAGGSARCWGLSFYDPALDYYRGSDLQPPAGPFQQIHPHDNGYCGHLRDGTVSCWGHDGRGAASPPAATFRWFEGDGSATYCGVTTDDEVLCWGRETKAPVAQAWLASLWPFEEISFSYRSVCARHAEGDVTCRSLGDLPDEEFMPPSGVRFQQLSSGFNFHCGIVADGEEVDGHRVLCWGCRWGEVTASRPGVCVAPPW